jgi:hypothetical protein
VPHSDLYIALKKSMYSENMTPTMSDLKEWWELFNREIRSLSAVEQELIYDLKEKRKKELTGAGA